MVIIISYIISYVNDYLVSSICRVCLTLFTIHNEAKHYRVYIYGKAYHQIEYKKGREKPY